MRQGQKPREERQAAQVIDARRAVICSGQRPEKEHHSHFDEAEIGLNFRILEFDKSDGVDSEVFEIQRDPNSKWKSRVHYRFLSCHNRFEANQIDIAKGIRIDAPATENNEKHPVERPGAFLQRREKARAELPTAAASCGKWRAMV